MYADPSERTAPALKINDGSNNVLEYCKLQTTVLYVNVHLFLSQQI